MFTKNLLRTAVAGVLLSCSAQAQSYVNTFNSPSGIGTLVKLNYNATATQPEALKTYTNGFAVVQFDETTGAVTNNAAINLGVSHTPVATAFAGTSEMVIGYNSTTFYYTFLNSATGAVAYSKGFARSTPLTNTITPIDIEYDGSTYFYVLFSVRLTMTSNHNSFGYFKINSSSGAISNVTVVDTPTDEFFPTDLEFVDNLHIYITSTRINSSGVETFALFRIGWDRIDLPYSTHGTSPGRMYIKANGTTLYLVFDMDNNIVGGTNSPLGFMKVTNNGGGSYTINYATIYYCNFNRIASVDMRSGYIVVGGTNQTLSAPDNILYNTATASIVDISEYSSVGTSLAARSVYMPASQRIFSVLKDKLSIPADLRTVVNSTALNTCYTAVNTSPIAINVTPGTITFPLKAESYSPTAISPLTITQLWTETTVCTGSLPSNSGGTANARIVPDNHFSVGPNPADDQLLLHAADNKSIGSVELYSLTGQLVLTQSASEAVMMTITTASLENGIYLVMIRNTDGTTEQQKIIVQHP